MTLEITYDSPIPAPSCDYIVKYRKYGATVYTEVAVTGTTLSATIASPCSIEGIVYGDCCDDSLSAGTPFGINSYQQLTVEVAVNVPLQKFDITVSSEYGNPYDTVVAGTISYTISGDPFTYDYEVTYSAGSTEELFQEGVVSAAAVITGDTITSVVPVFNTDGQIQQFDSVNTPNYFQFMSTTGHTWDGSPTTLPSFTTNALIALEVEDSVVTQANLLCSWVYDSVYEDGVAPYDFVTFQVYDEDNALLSEQRQPVSPVGLRNITLFLEKAARELNTTNVFTMVTKWDDDSTIASLEFTLPEVTL